MLVMPFITCLDDAEQIGVGEYRSRTLLLLLYLPPLMKKRRDLKAWLRKRSSPTIERRLEKCTLTLDPSRRTPVSLAPCTMCPAKANLGFNAAISCRQLMFYDLQVAPAATPKRPVCEASSLLSAQRRAYRYLVQFQPTLDQLMGTPVWVDGLIYRILCHQCCRQRRLPGNGLFGLLLVFFACSSGGGHRCSGPFLTIPGQGAGR